MSDISKFLGIDFEKIEPKGDRMLGMIFGHCIGSAVGHLTRYKRYPAEFKFPYTEKVKYLRANDWTNTSDQMLLLVDEAVNFSELADLVKFYPKKFKDLIENGRKGQKRASANIFNMLVSDKRYENDSTSVATDLWKKSNGKFCDNSGISKTICAACIPSGDMSTKLAERLCSITHVDMRCVNVASYLNTILWGLLHGGTFNIVEQVVDDISSEFEGDIAKYHKYGKSLQLKSANIDEIGKENDITKLVAIISFVFESVRFAKKNSKMLSFGKIISSIAKLGGDADVNCAISGAILGAFMGLTNIDKKYYSKMPDLHDLTSSTISFANMFCLVPKYELKLADIANSANVLLSIGEKNHHVEDYHVENVPTQVTPAEVIPTEVIPKEITLVNDLLLKGDNIEQSEDELLPIDENNDVTNCENNDVTNCENNDVTNCENNDVTNCESNDVTNCENNDVTNCESNDVTNCENNTSDLINEIIEKNGAKNDEAAEEIIVEDNIEDDDKFNIEDAPENNLENNNLFLQYEPLNESDLDIFLKDLEN